ncbi:type I toxin-antitoxin system SymE family toxin [Erwinia amylovora]|uniref:type I toxin-antitoxin system SymE family toxin n=1 Tax=Erwinia amylovora TaxID=552 RepID=UPI0021F37F81|nr:type I toxin-antitoxin system SymE family toxin [Erwinia amylovora]MCV6962188.1 type I toxin-antitoxin system SymE family toxin [Erwinia amylovora]MCZ2719831.1 type I toxin-antitoxin system SymE family toxin [Erwinia amylovora]MCZ2731142.1 type I toxin-antitoxin system SymE family toxin [Erwinia amylovora]UZB33983.1 type I toxin-antitoxin system SymE family toxin [Erwinia amylovora]UZB37311.1 type I toxin-antitoxin system SymE family toxin [Erwinia amylovora]
MQVRTGNVQNERRVIVGYRPKGGERDAPQVSIADKWLAEAGIAVGTGVNLTVPDGCLLPIPASREERRLRAMEQLLKAQHEELEQAKQRMIAMLA